MTMLGRLLSPLSVASTNPIPTVVMAIVIMAVAILTILAGRAWLNTGGRDRRYLLRLLSAQPFILVADRT